MTLRVRATPPTRRAPPSAREVALWETGFAVPRSGAPLDAG